MLRTLLVLPKRALGSVFAYDEFNDRNMVIAKPPWQTGDPVFAASTIDTDYTHTLIWLQRNWDNARKLSYVRLMQRVART